MKWKMENLKPAAIAWVVTMVMLFITMWYGLLFTEQIPRGIVGTIFFISLIVYLVFYGIYRKKK